MTKEFKEKILKYLVGNLKNEDKPNNTFEAIDLEEYTNNLHNYIITNLSTNSYEIKDVIQSITNSNVVIHGWDLDNENSFVIVVDNNLSSLKLITKFTSNVKFGYFYGFNVDENGNFYCIEANSNYINQRFLMLNNITVSDSKDEYQVKIRKSYAIPSNSIIKSNTVQFVKKGVGQAIYLIFTRNARGTEFYFTKLTENVGSENEWKDVQLNLRLIGGYDDVWVSIDPDEKIKIIIISNFIVNIYNNGTESCHYLSTDFVLNREIETYRIVNDTLAYVFLKLFDNNNIMTDYRIYKIDLTKYTMTMIYKEQTDYGVYSNDINSISSQSINNEVLFKMTVPTNLSSSICKIVVGRIIDNEVIYTNLLENISIPENTLDFFKVTKNFNLYQYFLQLDNQVYSCKEIYVSNGYNGIEYENINSLVPELGIFYSDNKLIFARTLYNLQINGNITVSSIQIPSTYLNDIEIDKKKLISETKSDIIDDTNSIIKNIYETVDVNFYNKINILDNDNSQNNISSARFNNSISDLNDYFSCQIGYYRLNFDDNTYEDHPLKYSQFIIDENEKSGKYEFKVYLNEKKCTSIQILSNDKNTVYANIDNLKLDVNSYYKITQKVEVV